MAADSVRFPVARLTLAMSIFGTIGVFSNNAGLDAVTTMFWRCLFASGFLGVWCLLRGYLPDRTLTRAGLARAALGGVCNMLSGALYIAAFATVSIGTATIVYHVAPFFVVLLGVVFLKERVTPTQIVWMIGAFFGIALASGLISVGDALQPGWMLGIGAALGAGLLYAIATILTKDLGHQRAEVTTLCQTIVGIALMAPFADFAAPMSAAGWGWIAGLGIIHTGIAYVLMYSAYPALSTPVIGVLSFVYPLVALLADWALYDGPLGFPQLAGLLLVTLGTLGVRLGWGLPWPRRLGRHAARSCLPKGAVRQPSP
ncbi:MAG TPA: DMT family transporter [Xanthobacteraceae bacterium]|nr:DMT family transporter [Xanthobacteraceae bacterium]